METFESWAGGERERERKKKKKGRKKTGSGGFSFDLFVSFSDEIKLLGQNQTQVCFFFFVPLLLTHLIRRTAESLPHPNRTSPVFFFFFFNYYYSNRVQRKAGAGGRIMSF